MDIMNVLRTGMNMFISRINIWLSNMKTKAKFEVLSNLKKKQK